MNTSLGGKPLTFAQKNEIVERAKQLAEAHGLSEEKRTKLLNMVDGQFASNPGRELDLGNLLHLVKFSA